MSWNATFPTPATRISQSVQQIQDNWAFLATNINTDHYFNSGAPNEGHHRFCQFVNQAGDPAVAVNSVVYAKATGTANSSQPFWRNATNVRQIPTLLTGTNAGIVAGVNVLVDLNAPLQPDTYGIIQIHQPGGNYYGLAYVVWTGGTTKVSQLAVDGVGVTAITASTTVVRVTAAFAGTLNYALYTLPV